MISKLNNLSSLWKQKLKKVGVENVDVLYDYEKFTGQEQYKLLVQTAGHVAGAIPYYQRMDVNPDPWPEEKVQP